MIAGDEFPRLPPPKALHAPTEFAASQQPRGVLFRHDPAHRQLPAEDTLGQLFDGDLLAEDWLEGLVAAATDIVNVPCRTVAAFVLQWSQRRVGRAAVGKGGDLPQGADPGREAGIAQAPD